MQTLFLNLSPSAIKARNGLESKGCRLTLQGFSHWRKLFPRIWHFSTVHPELKQFSVPLEMRTPLPLLRLSIVLLAGLRGFSVNKDNFFSLTKKTCSATFKPRTGFTLYHFTCKKKKRVERSFFFFPQPRKRDIALGLGSLNFSFARNGELLFSAGGWDPFPPLLWEPSLSSHAPTPRQTPVPDGDDLRVSRPLLLRSLPRYYISVVGDSCPEISFSEANRKEDNGMNDFRVIHKRVPGKARRTARR